MSLSMLSPPPFPQTANMHAYGAVPQQMPPRPYISSSASRYGIAHGQNSAQSAANPDEDWTKISDLAERRRIQNRIAQRNYRERKKLKRRLEDLERRASASPPPGTTGALPSQHDLAGPKRRPSKTGALPLKRSPNLTPGVFGSPYTNDYAAGTLYPGRRDSRQPSITPPPSMTSAGSTTTSPSMPSVYQHQAPAQPYYSGHYSDAAYPSMQPPVLPPPTGLGLSRMADPQEPWAPNKPYGGDEMFGQFGMSSQYPNVTTGAPFESAVAGVTTGYPEQSIYSNPPLGY